jgi:hypothetical protein
MNSMKTEVARGPKHALEFRRGFHNEARMKHADKKPAQKHRSFVSHQNARVRHERALATMHPVFASRVKSVIAHLNKKGWQAFVFQGKDRTPKQAESNAKTRVGIKMSWHRPDVYGRIGDQILELYAADIIDERWGWEGPVKDLDHPFWKDLGKYAKASGLEWGGDWKKRDVAHVQMIIIDAAPSGSVVV